MVDEGLITSMVLKNIKAIEEALQTPVRRDFQQSCIEMGNFQMRQEAASVPDRWLLLEDRDQINENLGLSQAQLSRF